MRSSLILLACSLLGIVGGAALIGRWAVGLAVIADSVALGWFALQRDDGRDLAPSVAEVPSAGVEWVLEKARRAS